MESIRTRFWYARRCRGLTQDEAARLFGVKTGTISRWERGETPLTLPCLERAAELFGVDRVWLVFGQGDVPQPLPSVRPPSELDAEDLANEQASSDSEPEDTEHHEGAA